MSNSPDTTASAQLLPRTVKITEADAAELRGLDHVRHLTERLAAEAKMQCRGRMLEILAQRGASIDVAHTTDDVTAAAAEDAQ